MRKPADILAMPVVIADLAVLAQFFFAKRAFDILQVLQCLVTLSFCGCLGCDGVVALWDGRFGFDGLLPFFRAFASFAIDAPQLC